MYNRVKGSLGYSGIVKILVLKGDKTIKTISTHNAGKDYLFQVLCASLCGVDNRNNMPKYFDFGVLDTTTLEFTSNLVDKVALSSRVITDFNTPAYESSSTIYKAKWGAQFTALIPSINILNSLTITVLRLYSSKNNESSLLAEVKLNNSNLLVNRDFGYNYLIEWVMTFENALEEAATAEF